MFGLMLSGGTVAALVVAGLVLRNKRMENGRKIYTTALAVSSLLVLTGASLMFWLMGRIIGGHVITRAEGALMTGCYVAYVVWLVLESV